MIAAGGGGLEPNKIATKKRRPLIVPSHMPKWGCGIVVKSWCFNQTNLIGFFNVPLLS